MSWGPAKEDTQIRWQVILAAALAIIGPFLILWQLWSGGEDDRQESTVSASQTSHKPEPTIAETFEEAAALAPPGVEAMSVCRDAELFRRILVGADYGPLGNPKIQVFLSCIGDLVGKVQQINTYRLPERSGSSHQVIMLHAENSLPDLLGELPVDPLKEGYLRLIQPGVYKANVYLGTSVRIIDGADCPDLPEGRILVLMGLAADSLDLSSLGQGDVKHLKHLLKLVPPDGKAWTVFDVAAVPDFPAMQGASYFAPQTGLAEIWFRADSEEDAQMLIHSAQEARKEISALLDEGFLPPDSPLAQRLRRTLSNSRIARKGKQVRARLDLPMGVVPAMLTFAQAKKKRMEHQTRRSQRSMNMTLLLMCLTEYCGEHDRYPKTWEEMIRGLSPETRQLLVTSSIPRPLDKMYLYRQPADSTRWGREAVILEAPALASGSGGGFSCSLDCNMTWHEQGQYLEMLEAFGVEADPNLLDVDRKIPRGSEL